MTKLFALAIAGLALSVASPALNATEEKDRPAQGIILAQGIDWGRVFRPGTFSKPYPYSRRMLICPQPRGCPAGYFPVCTAPGGGFRDSYGRTCCPSWGCAPIA